MVVQTVHLCLNQGRILLEFVTPESRRDVDGITNKKERSGKRLGDDEIRPAPCDSPTPRARKSRWNNSTSCARCKKDDPVAHLSARTAWTIWRYNNVIVFGSPHQLPKGAGPNAVGRSSYGRHAQPSQYGGHKGAVCVPASQCCHTGVLAPKRRDDQRIVPNAIEEPLLRRLSIRNDARGIRTAIQFQSAK